MKEVKNFSEIDHSVVYFSRGRVGMSPSVGNTEAFDLSQAPDPAAGDWETAKHRAEHVDDGWFNPSIPAVDLPKPASIPLESSALPPILRRPLLKVGEEIQVMPSGARSAVIAVPQDGSLRYYRLKGCGMPGQGFTIDRKMHDSGVANDLRGAQFEHTLYREQVMSHLIARILAEHNIPAANIPVGWWEYDSSISKSDPVRAYCGIFETGGDGRLAADLLFGLETALPTLVPTLPPPSENLQKREGMGCFACLFTPDEPLEDLRKIDMGMRVPCFEEVKEKYGLSPELEQIWNECKEVIEKEGTGDVLARLYWTIGFETGLVKRILQEHDIMWGTYKDIRDRNIHCNSHGNNMAVHVPWTTNESEDFLLAPLDFDMAFTKDAFFSVTGVPKEEQWDEWVAQERDQMRQAMIGLDCVSPSIRMAEVAGDWDLLRTGLRETLAVGYDAGFEIGATIKGPLAHPEHHVTRGVRCMAEIGLMCAGSFRS